MIIKTLSALTLLASGTWHPLFDGKTFHGWTLGDGSPVTHSWTIEDGAISTVAGTRGRSDLLCERPLSNFELEFEFRLSPGANTGVKYLVQHTLRYLHPGTKLAGSYGAVGLEFQLADNSMPDVSHPDQKLGALYGLLAPTATPEYKVGDWAQARLRCHNGVCEHWINGKRVLTIDLASPALKEKLLHAATDPSHSIIGAASAQVATRRRPGPPRPAFIALQQHDSKAWFRSLRVREID